MDSKQNQSSNNPENSINDNNTEKANNNLAKKSKINIRVAAIFLVLIIVFAIIASTVFTSVLRIYGDSMTPTMQKDSIAIVLKHTDVSQGDIVAFRHNNKILVKRIIAMPNSDISIDKDGNVYIDDKLLDEPYIADKVKGECNITFPYHVPEGRYFVMGDNRKDSVDSRCISVGCVSQEQLIGKVIK